LTPRIGHGSACGWPPFDAAPWGIRVRMQWSADTPLDFVQTVALMFMCAALIYAIRMVGKAIDGTVKGLRDPLLVVLKDHEQTQRQLTAIWKRLEALEDRMASSSAAKWKRLETLEERMGACGSDRATLGEWVGKAWQHIVKTEARLEALEKGEPPPPGTRPTDPPL
jgi:uncharacterized coiled-coil protein SlyX